MQHHTDASPKPSPVGPSSSELLPEPSAPKKSVSRCLHELQDPSSPTKPRKLCRTESMLYVPVLNLGDAVLSVPVSMDHVHPLPVDVKFEEADGFINIIAKDANSMDTEASDDKGMQVDKGTQVDKGKQVDSDSHENKPPLDPSDEDALESPSVPQDSLPMVRSYSLDLPTDPKQLIRFNEDVRAIKRRICGN